VHHTAVAGRGAGENSNANNALNDENVGNGEGDADDSDGDDGNNEASSTAVSVTLLKTANRSTSRPYRSIQTNYFSATCTSSNPSPSNIISFHSVWV
jgi:hypothetical protein